MNFIMYVKGSAGNSFTKDNNLISSVNYSAVSLVSDVAVTFGVVAVAWRKDVLRILRDSILLKLNVNHQLIVTFD